MLHTPTRDERLYTIERAAEELASLAQAIRTARLDLNVHEETPLSPEDCDAIMHVSGRVSGNVFLLMSMEIQQP